MNNDAPTINMNIHIVTANLITTSIKDWLKENNIGSNEEKQILISKDIYWAFIENKLSLEDLSTIKNKLKTDEFIFKEGDLFSDISKYFNEPKYCGFFKYISQLTPCGLNTSPNACCGKFELLYRLLRPKSLQPKKGDIEDNGKRIEIKGEQVRMLDMKLKGEDLPKSE